MMKPIIRQPISIASIALFLGGLLWVNALWWPVFETEQRDIAGYWIFLTGWMGFVVFQFAWYANLLLLVAVILMYNSPVRATLLAALGLLVAMQAFWFDALPETTRSVEIIDRGPGFWLWYAGIFLMSVGVFFCSDTDEAAEVTEAVTPPRPQPISPQETEGSHNITPETNITNTVKAEAEKEPSLLAQLEAVRKAGQKTLDQQKRVGRIQQAEQEAAMQKVDEERMESTLPAVKAILADALFGDDKNAETQPLPAFLLDGEDEAARGRD